MPTGGVFGTGATDFFCTAVGKRLGGPRPAACGDPLPMLILIASAARARRPRGRPRDLASRRPLPPRAPAGVGSDPRGRGSHVPDAREALPRDRAPVHPARRRHLDSPGARTRRVRPPRGRRDRRVGRRTRRRRALRSGRRSRCSGWRSCRRPRPRLSSSSTKAERSARSTPTGSWPEGSGRSLAPSPSPWRSGSHSASSAFLLPVAIWLAVRWALLAQVVELEDRRATAALRRSAELVRGRWLRVGSLVGAGAILAFAAGPLLGALLILADERAAAAPQHRRGHRLRACAAFRGADDVVRVLRRQGPPRARADSGAGRASGRDPPLEAPPPLRGRHPPG